MKSKISIAPTREVFFAHDTGVGNLQQFYDGLDEVLRKRGFTLRTFRDEVALGNTFFEKIYDQIRRAAFVIADIGCREAKEGESVITNANVAHEIGIATALGKIIIVLAKKENVHRIAANLRSKDILLYPDCLQVGNPELKKLEKTIGEIANKLLVAEPVRIFQNAGTEYQSTLRQLTSLEGDVFYLANHIRAFFRPPSAERRWLKEVRRITSNIIEKQSEMRRQRKKDWQNQLTRFGCIDIYERHQLEDDVRSLRWRNFSVTREEMLGFLVDMEHHLKEFPNYQVSLVDEILNSKFWIKESGPTSFVVLEGLEYESLGKHIIGGIIFASNDVGKKFKQEFDRLLNEQKTTKSKDEVYKWIKQQTTLLERG